VSSVYPPSIGMRGPGTLHEGGTRISMPPNSALAWITASLTCMLPCANRSDIRQDGERFPAPKVGVVALELAPPKTASSFSMPADRVAFGSAGPSIDRQTNSNPATTQRNRPQVASENPQVIQRRSRMSTIPAAARIPPTPGPSPRSKGPA